MEIGNEARYEIVISLLAVLARVGVRRCHSVPCCHRQRPARRGCARRCGRSASDGSSEVARVGRRGSVAPAGGALPRSGAGMQEPAEEPPLGHVVFS